MPFLIGALLFVIAAAIIDRSVLLSRIQLVLTHSEQTVAAAAQLLAQVPGKSAPPQKADEPVTVITDLHADTEEAAEVLVAHWSGGMPARPVPYRRDRVGRHAAP